jgi:catechol 2,3-dioxygenase-like lactoylglutathione lyase family enzyme
MAGSSKTSRGRSAYGRGMTPRLASFEIVVADMAKALAFYRRLGLDIPASADGEPHVRCDITPDVALMFDTEATIQSFDPSWSRTTGAPQMSIAFACATPADVDALYADLVGAGYEGHLEPWDAFWGMRYAVVHDPDGNGVDLAAPLSPPTS